MQDPGCGTCPYFKTGKKFNFSGKESLSTMTCHAKPEI